VWQITAADIDDLATGASLFGAGGGGEVRLITPLIKRLIAEHGPVPVVAAHELPPGGYVVPVGGAGSDTLLAEKPMAGDEFVRAVNKIIGHTGQRVDAVACDVAAGLMLLFAVLAAAQLRMPLLDADSARRGVPRLDQSLLTFAGVRIAPLALSDGGGGNLIIDGLDNEGTERAIRATLGALGGWVCYAMRPLAIGDARRAMAAGSVRAARDLGRLARQGDDRSLAADFGMRELFRGKVTEVRRRPMESVAAGSAATAVIEHADGSGRVLRVELQSEYLLAIEDGDVVACVPDLICLVERAAVRCLSAERLRYGLWVRVVALPCLPQWRTPAGLALLGPRAFGYDFDYVPLEEPSMEEFPVDAGPAAVPPAGGTGVAGPAAYPAAFPAPFGAAGDVVTKLGSGDS
jgi:uncharacterized protein